MNREKKRMASLNLQGEEIPSRGVPGSRWGYLEGCKQKKDGEGKSKEKDSTYVTDSDGFDALILSLAVSSESWVIDSSVSFHATSQHDIFQNYLKGELENMYLGDDEPCDIIRKGDVG